MRDISRIRFRAASMFGCCAGAGTRSGLNHVPDQAGCFVLMPGQQAASAAVSVGSGHVDVDTPVGAQPANAAGSGSAIRLTGGHLPGSASPPVAVLFRRDLGALGRVVDSGTHPRSSVLRPQPPQSDWPGARRARKLETGPREVQDHQGGPDSPQLRAPPGELKRTWDQLGSGSPQLGARRFDLTGQFLTFVHIDCVYIDCVHAATGCFRGQQARVVCLFICCRVVHPAISVPRERLDWGRAGRRLGRCWLPAPD